MKVDIIPIGNSKGIRIPKALLDQCGFSNSIEIEVEKDRLVLKNPVAPLRQGWAKASRRMRANGDDPLLDAETVTEFDKSEWQW